MAEEYTIRLGVDLDDAQLNNVKTTINNLVDKERKINLDIDFNIKNANRLSDVGREIEKIQSQLKDLSDVGSIGKGKSPISIDSKSLESSLNKIHNSIKKLQSAFGKVDGNKGVQSLLTTVNKIRASLEGVAKQFESLNRNLTNLSSKDFSLNFDFGFGNSAKNPEQAIKELKMLQKEVAEYENYFRKHYSLESSNTDPINRLLRDYNQRSQVYGIQLQQAMNKGTDPQKIAAYKEYINLIKETAAIGNISLAPVDFRLAESGEFVKVRNEANETKKQLQELFSGGINAENLHRTLDEIAQDLTEIKNALGGVSSEAESPINQLTQSFNRLSDAIEQLVSNAAQVKNVLGDGLSNATSVNTNAISNIEKASDNATAAVVQNEKKKQEAYKATTDAAINSLPNEQIANVGLENVESDLKQVTLTSKNTVEAIRSMQDSLKNMKFGSKSIDVVTKELQGMGIEIKEASAQLKGTNLDVTVKGVDSLGETVTVVRRLNTETNQISQVGTKIKQSFSTSDDFIKEVNKEMANFVRLQKEISQKNIDLEIAKSQGGSVEYINALETELKGLESTYDRLMQTFMQKISVNADLVSFDELTKFNDKIDAINKGTEHKIGKIVDESNAKILKDINSEMANFVRLESQIGDMKTKIGKLELAGGNDNQVAELKRQLEDLEDTYARLMQTFSKKLVANADIVSMDEVAKFDDEIKAATDRAEAELREFDAKYADTRAKLAQDIKSNIGTTIANNIDKVHVNFNKLSGKTDELKAQLDLLDSVKIDLDEAAAVNDIDRLIDANTRYQKVLKDVQAQINIAQRAEKVAFGTLGENAFILDKEKAMLNLHSLFGKNSEAAKRFASEINRIEKEIRECGTADGLKIINKDIDVLGQKVKEAGVKTQTFGQKLKHQFQQYTSYLSVASLFSYASQGLRDMFEQVKLIDSAMTELKKVTDETDADYNKFLSNAADRAKAIGTTIDGLVSSTADFARLGYGFEDAQGLAEVANIYAVVGDEINGVEGATESLISTMAAFKDEMNGMSKTDFAMSIIDKFNEIGKLIA